MFTIRRHNYSWEEIHSMDGFTLKVLVFENFFTKIHYLFMRDKRYLNNRHI